MEGCKVETQDGKIAIEEIKEHQKVLCASGQAKTMIGTVDKKMKKEYKGPIVRIKTKSGKEIKGTPNHIGFARLNPQPGVYYVYLMYKKGYGYRIGQTQGVRSRKGEITNGLAVRLNQEHADKMWILKVCFSKDEAHFYEQLYAFKYGIPTTVFHANGRKMTLLQEHIDAIYKEINTEKAAINLMNDLCIFEEYPQHLCNAVVRGQSIRRIVNVTSFGGRETGLDAGWHGHRICLNTSGEDLKEKASKDFPVRDGQRNTWRIETERKEYDEAYLYARELAQLDDTIDIVKKARLTEKKSFYYMPLAHMKPTMHVAVYEDGKIIEDIIEEVVFEEYDGYVYDLSVPHFRQYICEGIVVHNSIYSWRGADIRNILNFEDDFKNATVIKLEQNYRSTQNILDAANCVIKNNRSRKNKKLWTSQESGEILRYYRAMNEHDEAGFVVKQIKDMVETDGRNYSEFAILYRTNAQSRVVEEMLMKAGIPYRIYGGLKFYDRKEIKDIIAYLRLIQNPVDDVSFKRVINVPKRGIGDRTVEKLEQMANQTGESIFSVILDDELIQGFSKRVKAGIKDFALLITKYGIMKEEIGITELIKNVLQESGYMDELRNENTVEAEARIENLQEFLSVAMDFERSSEVNTLEEFLSNISLVSDLDTMDDEENAVVLMTLHSAKGLEFPVVFLIGMEERIFPISRALESDRDLEEERRLCYVGITRAEEMLFLTHARMRTLYGRTNYNPMSRFIDEIEERLIDMDKEEMKKRDQKALAPNIGIYRGATLKETPKPINTGSKDVRPGSKVKHDKFGIGTIISVKKSTSGTELTIAFDNAGIKKLIKEFAPISVI
nr:3'-5' exonuclease [Crassaminicella thermophila]